MFSTLSCLGRLEFRQLQLDLKKQRIFEEKERQWLDLERTEQQLAALRAQASVLCNGTL